MSRAQQIIYIVIHCSAGFAGKEAIEAYWKTLGWKAPGYHRLIAQDGEIYKLLDFEKISNGVGGYNTHCVNICYIGGVEKKGKTFLGKDTRTPQQKEAIIKCIKEAIEWLKANGNDCAKVVILGHRDFSKDANNSGVIESWERIKECPSFDAIPEYAEIQLKLNGKKKVKLPNSKA